MNVVPITNYGKEELGDMIAAEQKRNAELSLALKSAIITGRNLLPFCIEPDKKLIWKEKLSKLENILGEGE
jgi:hypothetical protein